MYVSNSYLKKVPRSEMAGSKGIHVLNLNTYYQNAPQKVTTLQSYQ